MWLSCKRKELWSLETAGLGAGHNHNTNSQSSHSRPRDAGPAADLGRASPSSAALVIRMPPWRDCSKDETGSRVCWVLNTHLFLLLYYRKIKCPALPWGAGEHPSSIGAYINNLPSREALAGVSREPQRRNAMC